MAAAGAALPLAASSPPPPVEDASPSNLSSPLSEVEDRDADPDEMDLDMSDLRSSNLFNSNKTGGRRWLGAASDSDDSNLSEIDVNDSEAETERLYDTPEKTRSIRDIVDAAALNGDTQPTRDNQVFERSPSKLQQQIQADIDAEGGVEDDDDDDDDEPLSELDDDEDEDPDNDDAASVASSTAEPDVLSAQANGRSPPPPTKRPQETSAQGSVAAADESNEDSTGESRKRKRAVLVEAASETIVPLKKRTGSVIAGDAILGAVDDVAEDEERGDEEGGEGEGDEEAIVTHDANLLAGNHHEDSPTKRKDDAAAALEEMATGNRAKNSRRSSMRRRKGSDDAGGNEEAHEDQSDEAAAVIADDETGTVPDEEQAEAEVDEEAEAQQRNEEELERKRAAWEQLTAIEKHFTAFRERLYEERLAALNEEEAMLTSETPTHPEYLAMMECVNARREDRMRIIDAELQLNLETLRTQTVARRAQILTQFYQSIRESREQTLDDLGRQWYEIQQKRRQYANNIPDYGLRFPARKSQRVMNAIAYNKEVSILSGIAKFTGFPAAPEMNGLTPDEVDADFMAMNQAKHQNFQNTVPTQQPFPEYSGLNFGSDLGPAGEQFLEQTPWANPNHPAHGHASRQPTGGGSLFPGSSTNKKTSRHSGNLFPAAKNPVPPGNMPNGDALVPQKSHKGASLDSRTSKGVLDMAIKRDPVAQTL